MQGEAGTPGENGDAVYVFICQFFFNWLITSPCFLIIIVES